MFKHRTRGKTVFQIFRANFWKFSYCRIKKKISGNNLVSLFQTKRYGLYEKKAGWNEEDSRQVKKVIGWKKMRKEYLKKNKKEIKKSRRIKWYW